jgi:hypothetical protein
MRSSDSMNDPSAKPASQEHCNKPISPKKPYNKPVLKVYGNIETITATVSNTSPQADGGTGTMNRTH